MSSVKGLSQGTFRVTGDYAANRGAAVTAYRDDTDGKVHSTGATDAFIAKNHLQPVKVGNETYYMTAQDRDKFEAWRASSAQHGAGNPGGNAIRWEPA